MSKYINEAEEPLFLFEANDIQFERVFQKMTQIEEENVQMKIKMNAQDELIEALTTKQTDAKVLKKEIKLLKDNLVNQCELIEEIKMMKVHVQKENRIKIARETAYNGLTDIADEIISKQKKTYNELSGIVDDIIEKQKKHLIDDCIKFKAIEKTNALIVQTINTIMDFNNPKRIFILTDILSSITNYFVSFTGDKKKQVNGRIIMYMPEELGRHPFLQNFINQFYNSGALDGHRIGYHHLPPSICFDDGYGVEKLTVKYIGRTLKIIETFVGELLEISVCKA